MTLRRIKRRIRWVWDDLCDWLRRQYRAIVVCWIYNGEHHWDGWVYMLDKRPVRRRRQCLTCGRVERQYKNGRKEIW